MTDVLEPVEVAEASTNGHVEQTEAFTLPEPDPAEKMLRFADPREETRRILQERLERVLQPVDDDEVWHGVNVVTSKDLDAALALDLPPTSIFSAAARTPAFIYVSAVCPVCSIVSEIDLEVAAKLEVEGQSRKLKLKAKATAKPHQCGQQRLDDLSPSRPIAVALDEDDDDLDAGDHAEDAELDEKWGVVIEGRDIDGRDGDTDAQAEADAVHALAMTPAREPIPVCDVETPGGPCSRPVGHDGDHDALGLPF